jgi:hypothetical protein
MHKLTYYPGHDDNMNILNAPDEPNEAILTALDRVNVSLRVVLAAIAELKAEMNSNRIQDVTPRQDDQVIAQ